MGKKNTLFVLEPSETHTAPLSVRLRDEGARVPPRRRNLFRQSLNAPSETNRETNEKITNETTNETTEGTSEGTTEGTTEQTTEGTTEQTTEGTTERPTEGTNPPCFQCVRGYRAPLTLR
jgi:hypothetical protein